MQCFRPGPTAHFLLPLSLLAACKHLAGDVASPAVAAVPEARFTVGQRVANGRLEDHAGLRVLRLWGTPAERGAAHVALLGEEIVELLRKELTARFGARPGDLVRARLLLPLIVRYPEPWEAELTAMFEGLGGPGRDLHMPAFERTIDRKDLALINAMDIVAMAGCSGFTLFGDQVEGGGVLTARNFDWPVTGPYMVERCLLIVHHPATGPAYATVGWPGYIGAVTGINSEGIAVFLHAGNSDPGMPRHFSMSTATAAREILARADDDSVFATADELLAGTSPPAGYMTRVVTARPRPGEAVRVYEVDRQTVRHRDAAGLCIVTNHFLAGDRPPPAGRDSQGRYDAMQADLRNDLSTADQKVSVTEAWAALQGVQRDGARFATLHSLVFRQEPWVFELAIGELGPDGVVRGAPASARRYRLAPTAVFAPID